MFSALFSERENISQPKEAAVLLVCANLYNFIRVSLAFGKILAVIFLIVHTIKHPFIDRHTIFPKKKLLLSLCVFFSEFSSLESYTHFSFLSHSHPSNIKCVVASRHFREWDFLIGEKRTESAQSYVWNNHQAIAKVIEIIVVQFRSFHNHKFTFYGKFSPSKKREEKLFNVVCAMERRKKNSAADVKKWRDPCWILESDGEKEKKGNEK